jgi:hypothetical protein
LLWLKPRQGSLIELSEIVIAEVHSRGGAGKRKSKLGRYPRTSDELCLATCGSLDGADSRSILAGGLNGYP